MVDPEDGLDGIDETTQEIVLTGTWTQEKIDQLAEKIHRGDESGNNALSTVDMSEVALPHDVSLEGLFTDCSNLTSVILPDLSNLDQISPDVFEGTNPNCLVFVEDGQAIPETWREQVNVVVDGNIGQLVLVEEKPFHSPLPFYAEQAVYRRTFTDNRRKGVELLPDGRRFVCRSPQRQWSLKKKCFCRLDRWMRLQQAIFISQR